MKVLDINHLINGVDEAKEDLESFYGQIENVQRSIRDFRSLDEALKGRSGEAMRSYFDQVHLPFLTLLHQSMIEYKAAISGMKVDAKLYDSNGDAIIKQAFLEQGLEEGFDNVESKAIELTDESNEIIREVQDLVSINKVDASNVVDSVRDGKERIETVVDDLKTLDEEKTSLLEKTKSDIHKMKTYLTDIGSMLTKGDLSIKNFSFDSVEGMDSYQSLMHGFNIEEGSGHLGFASLFEKMVDGQALTSEERNMVYNYIQNVVITNDVRKDMDELVKIIEKNSSDEELKDRVNNEVLVTEDALNREMAIIQAYLYNGNENPDNQELKHDRDKLQSYLSVLENYKKAIGEVKKDMDWDHETGSPLLAKVEDLDYYTNQDPHTLTLTSNITIWLHQYEGSMSRSEFMSMERPLIVRENESEVTYFQGNLSSVQLQNSINDNLEEELANYTSNFMGEEALSLLIGNAGKATIPLTVIDTFARLEAGRNELTEEIQMGEVKATSTALDMQIQISDRFMPGSGSKDYVVQTHPTKHTFSLLDRWKEAYENNPDIPYPEQEIKDQNWNAIARYLSGNESTFKEINPNLSDFIIKGSLDSESTVKEVANEE